MDNKEKSTQELLHEEILRAITVLKASNGDFPQWKMLQNIEDAAGDFVSLANDQQFEISRMRERIQKLIAVLNRSIESQSTVSTGVLMLYLETL